MNLTQQEKDIILSSLSDRLNAIIEKIEHQRYTDINFKLTNPDFAFMTPWESIINELQEEKIIIQNLIDRYSDGENSIKCWRKQGCIHNSNFPSYHKCMREDYSIELCKKENYNSYCPHCGIYVKPEERKTQGIKNKAYIKCPWCNESFSK